MEAEMSVVYPLRRSPLKYDFIATIHIETLLFDIWFSCYFCYTKARGKKGLISTTLPEEILLLSAYKPRL